MKEGRANAVKLEGGKEFAEHIRAITAASVPVVAHLGLTPQSLNAFGGFHLFYILLEPFFHHTANLCKAFDKFWLEISKHCQHILIYQNLSVAICSSSYSNRRDMKLIRHKFVQLSP